MVIDYVTGEQLLDMEAWTCCKSFDDSVDRDELIKFSDMIWMSATRTEIAQNQIAACRGPCRSLG